MRRLLTLRMHWCHFTLCVAGMAAFFQLSFGHSPLALHRNALLQALCSATCYTCCLDP